MSRRVQLDSCLSVLRHRVDRYLVRANIHRRAAREWRTIARDKPEAERDYLFVLAETQDDLAQANATAAEKLGAATDALAAARRAAALADEEPHG